MPRHTDSRGRLLAVASDLIWTQSYYGTSVDEICAKCEIKKGSFYHHFESKELLVIEALEASWIQYKGFLDQVFSASLTPVERIIAFSEGSLKHQEHTFATHGKVLGCPLYTLGTEIGTQEPTLRAKIDEHLQLMERYFRETLAEAEREGLIQFPDLHELSMQMLSYCEGSMTLARIRNDLAPIKRLRDGLLRLAGFPLTKAA